MPFIIIWRDVFNPGMKYLYGRYCPCCCRDGMQNILASYKRKIKLVKKLLQSSNLVYSLDPLIIPSLIKYPLRPSKTLSYLRSVKPNTSAILPFCVLIFYTYNICLYIYISRAFILFIAVRPSTTPTFPSPSRFYQFFSPAVLTGEILLMSDLENK